MPDLKLFACEVYTIVPIAAESIEEARRYAETKLLSDMEDEEFLSCVSDLDHQLDGYDDESYPFGWGVHEALGEFQQWRDLDA
jgi:hypothetical protein